MINFRSIAFYDSMILLIIWEIVELLNMQMTRSYTIHIKIMNS